MRTSAKQQTTKHQAMALRRIGKRGKARLMIAARLLRLSPTQVGDEAVYCEVVLAAIGRLSEARRAALRDQVDWVEAYENQERQLQRPGR